MIRKARVFREEREQSGRVRGAQRYLHTSRSTIRGCEKETSTPEEEKLIGGQPGFP